MTPQLTQGELFPDLPRRDAAGQPPARSAHREAEDAQADSLLVQLLYHLRRGRRSASIGEYLVCFYLHAHSSATGPEMAEALGEDTDYIQRAVTGAHRHGFIHPAGMRQRPRGSGPGSDAYLWALSPEGERLVANLRARIMRFYRRRRG
ncbi:MAG: hypothetical protein ACI4OZ_10165 [Akkermansia sp.]